MRIAPGICSLLVLALAATSHAQSIGVNFIGKDAKAQTLEATQSAGVAAVAQDHWNNVSVSEDDANGHDNGGSLDKVNDNAGKEVKGASVTVAATQDTQVWPTNAASWGFTETNLGGTLAQDMTYTLGWGAFAVALLVAGIVVRSRPARFAALALLVVTVLKGFLHDLARLGGLYRVVSFVGLAVCLALVAVVLQKFVLRPPERDVHESVR